MEFLLSVAGLVIAMWVLDRGDWETHRLQIVVGWVVVAGIAVSINLADWQIEVADQERHCMNNGAFAGAVCLWPR